MMVAIIAALSVVMIASPVMAQNMTGGQHSWKEITASGMFTNHNSNGDSLYGAEILHIQNIGMKV
jgi:hypothetical protein